MKTISYAYLPETPLTNANGLNGLGLLLLFAALIAVTFILVRLIRPILDRQRYKDDREYARVQRDLHRYYRDIYDDLDDE